MLNSIFSFLNMTHHRDTSILKLGYYHWLNKSQYLLLYEHNIDHATSQTAFRIVDWPYICTARSLLRPYQHRVLHVHQLPLDSSSNHIVLGEVLSDTICNISYDFQDCKLAHMRWWCDLHSSSHLSFLQNGRCALYDEQLRRILHYSQVNFQR